MDDSILDDAAAARLTRIGGIALVKQMIELFLEHAPERIASAEGGLAVGDMRAVEHAAHSLKSSAGNVGATRLQRAAEAVEQASESGTTANLPELLRSMRTEFDAATFALRAQRATLT